MEEKKNMEATKQSQTEELAPDQLDGAAGGTGILIEPKDRESLIRPKPAPNPFANSEDSAGNLLNADDLYSAGNPFKDMPRVPLKPIDPALRGDA